MRSICMDCDAIFDMSEDLDICPECGSLNYVFMDIEDFDNTGHYEGDFASLSGLNDREE